MSYQALYRVWRPQRFQDIAGQTAITQTLRNALVQEKSSHAYLFTGPRGTGKTSAAKIFAKTINCHFMKDGEPCNECETCRAITKNQLNDVIEIDAASNNGVEEIRDIRDKAKYAPTGADYKVYIIDEVHMLSTGAFNALLKTLEEPPVNVIFILATTEPHKIPLTIISRTQRFDFKRISVRDICERMVYILNQENTKFEEAALPVIARAAEGGMRDALSILDQAISFGDNRVTVANAMSVTGSLTQELLLEYFEAILTSQTNKGLSLLQEILADGKDAARFVEDLILFSRDLLVYQQAPETGDLLEGATLDEGFKSLSREVPSHLLYQIIAILNGTQNDIRYTNHPEVYLEVATVKLTQLNLEGESNNHTIPGVTRDPDEEFKGTGEDEQKVKALEHKVAEMKKQLDHLMANGAAAGTAGPQKSAPKKMPQKAASGAFKPNTTAIYRVLKEATKENLIQLKEVWPDLLNMLSVTQRAVLKASTPVAGSPDGLIVSFDYDILCQKATNDSELIEVVGEYLRRLVGYTPSMICVTADQWPVIRGRFIEQNRTQIKSKPMKEKERHEQRQTDQQENGRPSDRDDPDFDHFQHSAAMGMPEAELEHLETPVSPTGGEEPVVTEAVQLFGEQIVEIKND